MNVMAEKKEKKEQTNFIPKESVEKPKIGHLTKIFSKKKEKESYIKSSQPAKIADPEKVQKVTRADFDKYEIAIPKTSNLYSENERKKFIEEENIKNRPKGRGAAFSSKSKTSAAPSVSIFDLPDAEPDKSSKSSSADSSAVSGPKFKDFDLFDDFDDDFDKKFGSGEDGDLFGDDDFMPKTSASGGNKTFDFSDDFDDDFDAELFGSGDSGFDLPAAGGDIFDRRRAQDKFSEVFGGASLEVMAKEVLLSNTVMEPAYKSRQRREAERKKRLGFM